MGDGGKGSRPRPFSVSQQEFDNRWDSIFGKKKAVFECGDCGWRGEVDDALPNENLDGHTCPSCGSEL